MNKELFSRREDVPSGITSRYNYPLLVTSVLQQISPVFDHVIPNRTSEITRNGAMLKCNVFSASNRISQFSKGSEIAEKQELA